MTKNCGTCLFKEGSCYPSKTIFDKDKTCKSYEPDYEGYIAGLEAQIEKMKWHKVSDGDLPKDEDWKWCVSYRGYYYVAKYEEMFGCWTNQEHSEVMQPYAWKEIVLPKESK